jgi:hypothetical protein
MNLAKTVMRSLLPQSAILILLMAGSALFAPAKPPADDLYLNVTMVTGEHSRDSHSTTTRLTAAADKLVYQQSYHGSHSEARTPVKKEYALTSI